jgi:hypothetical protein
MNVSGLPPKMTQQFADRAKRGDYHHKLGDNIFLWLQGHQEICLIGLDYPTGHIKKLSTRELEEKKRQYGLEKKS